MAKEHTGFRVDPELLGRLDVIAAEMTRRAAGAEVRRAEAARAALARGVESIEAELGITKHKGGKAPRKAK